MIGKIFRGASPTHIASGKNKVEKTSKAAKSGASSSDREQQRADDQKLASRYNAKVTSSSSKGVPGTYNSRGVVTPENPER